MKPIFIHIPKTAGTSIGMLPVECDIHSYPEAMLEKVGTDYWNKALKFTVIRHPCDRLVSAYYYAISIWLPNAYREICLRENHCNPVKWSKLPNDNFWKCDARESIYCQQFSSLEDFVFNGKLTHWLHFIPQINWLKLKLDKVMHYETVNEEIEEIFEEKLLKLNYTQHPCWKELFNAKMIQRVREIYKEDFEFEKNMPNSMWE
jgi:hypothetical protein